MTTRISFLLVLIPLLTVGQITFEAGYYISNDGDTIRCQIQNVGWKNNPEQIKIKNLDGESILTKGLSEIIEFSIPSEFVYRRFLVQVNQAPKNSYTNNPQPELDTLNVFLKILLNGKATLYEYIHSNTENYFFSLDGSIPACLIYKKFMNTNGIVQENNYFQKQLWENLHFEGLNLKEIARVKYNKSSLVQLIQSYNRSFGEKNEIKVPKNDVNRLKLYPNIGMVHASGRISNPREFGNSEYVILKNGIFYTVGLSLEYLLPFNKNKWGLTFQSTYHSYFSSGEFLPNIDIKRSAIEFPLGIIHYFYLKRNNKIFINSSFVSSLQINFENTLELHSRNVELDSGNHLFIKSGIEFNRFRLEIGYHTSRNLLQKYYFWFSRYQRFYLGLGINLF